MKLDKVGEKYDNYDFHRGLIAIMDQLRNVNNFLDRHKPWILAKENKEDHLTCVLAVTMENLRICAILLQPIIPNLSEKLLTTLGIEKQERTINQLNQVLNFNENRILSPSGSLYDRIKFKV